MSLADPQSSRLELDDEPSFREGSDKRLVSRKESKPKERKKIGKKGGGMFTGRGGMFTGRSTEKATGEEDEESAQEELSPEPVRERQVPKMLMPEAPDNPAAPDDLASLPFLNDAAVLDGIRTTLMGTMSK